MNRYTCAVLAAPAAAAVTFFATPAFADTISPTSFSADLAVGEEEVVRKTVVIEAAGPSDALIDVHFLFDTSSSMGGVIAGAKTAASDILAALSSFGDAAASVGVYSEAARATGTVPALVVNQDLTTDTMTAIDAIGDVTLSVPDFGFDGPENGVTGVELATEGLSWRAGSSRFMFVFGDVGFKTSDMSEATGGSGLTFDPDGVDDNDGAPISTAADAIAALAAESVDLYGLSFGFGFDDAIESLGGTAFASSTSPAAIVADITAGITAGFAEYERVTVDDLGGGGSLIDVSTVCVSADIGMCDGAEAVGDYDRTTDRTFTFDVTFKRTGSGTAAFDTFALVDGGRVATESDRFPATTGGGGGMAPIPLPAAGWLMIAGLGGLAVARRQRS